MVFSIDMRNYEQDTSFNCFKHIYKIMPRILFLSLLLLFSSHSLARMYQWVETDSGTTQLSGKPPSWYRNGEPGPRVLVFEKGRLVDDTDIELSREARRELRKRAFIMAEEDRLEAKEKLIRSRELKNNYIMEEEEIPLPAVVGDEASADAVLEELEQNEDAMSEEEREREQKMMEQMREMVEEWEDNQAVQNRPNDT